MFYVILALSEPGVEVIYPNPGFPIYESMIRFSGGTPVPMRLLESKAYHPDLDDLAQKITSRTRLIIINSPENPCGSALTLDELETIANLVKERDDIYVMSDEIYKDILYTGEHHSSFAFPGLAAKTILLGGFAKSYAMTGFSLGYGIRTPYFSPSLHQLALNPAPCAAPPPQLACVPALDAR